MRQRLLEATVDCLVEHGWSGTSTTLVSQRAGVSRGAQLHHFPTKNDLVLAAVEHLSELRGQELREAAAAAADRQAAYPRRAGDVRRPLHQRRSSPPRSSCGSRPAPTRRCTRPSYPSSSGSAARRTASPSRPSASTSPGRGSASWCRRPSTWSAASAWPTRSPTTPPGATASSPPGRTPSTSELRPPHERPPRRRCSPTSPPRAPPSRRWSRRSTTPAGVRRPRRPAGTSPPRSPTSPGPTRSRSPPPPTRRPGTRSCSRRSATPRASSTPRRSRARRPSRPSCSPAGAPPGAALQEALRDLSRRARRCRGSARR